MSQEIEKTTDGNPSEVTESEGTLPNSIEAASLNSKGKDDVTIHKSVEAGDIESVIMWLKLGAKIESLDENGNTPLIVAANRGHLAIIELLLREGADIEANGYVGTTPLIAALNNIAVIELLLREGADVNAKGKYPLYPLSLAAELGYADAVGTLLTGGADIVAKDQNGLTALHYAAMKGHEAVVSLLINSGADVNLKNELGYTALYLAAMHGREAVASLLIKSGADLNLKDLDGETALYRATINGGEAVASLLIKSGANVNLKNEWGYTALHYAAMYGREAVASLLIESGANVNLKNVDGNTALHRAAMKGHEAVATLLINKGADIDATNNDGERALSVILKRFHPAIADSLLSGDGWKDSVSLFHKAANDGNLKAIECLLDLKVKVDAKDGNGNTALHGAVRDGRESLASLLIKSGADVNLKNYWGYTALHLAARDGHESVATLLIEGGADLNLKDVDGNAALHYAARDEREAVASLLIKSGADLNLKGHWGNTALHYAARDEREAVASLLIKSGADVNLKDSAGYTALHEAAMKGHESVASLLIEGGADVNLKDEWGYTVLQTAAMHGMEAVASLLIKSGADVNLKSHWGNTALHYAAMKGHESVASLLIEGGADIDATNNNGERALSVILKRFHPAIADSLLSGDGGKDSVSLFHKAAKDGNLKAIKCLLDLKVKVDSKDQNGSTALHYASMKGHEAVASLLIESGAEVNLENNVGDTAFILAAFNGYYDLALKIKDISDVNPNSKNGAAAIFICATKIGERQLVLDSIEKGADIDAKDNAGNTALFVILERFYPEVYKAVLSDKALHSTVILYNAAVRGDLQVVKCLLDLKVKVIGIGEDLYTAFHLAALNGHLEIVKLFIERGVDVNSANKYGATALEMASEDGKLDIVEYLLDHGANIDAVYNKGDLYVTGLVGAIRHDRWDVAEVLIVRGANPNIADKNGDTALHWAISKGQWNIAELLLKFGALPNAQNALGNTALHDAVSYVRKQESLTYANVDRFVALVSMEDPVTHLPVFNVNLKGKDGNTLLDLVTSRYDPIAKNPLLQRMIYALREAGAIEAAAGGISSEERLDIDNGHLDGWPPNVVNVKRILDEAVKMVTRLDRTFPNRMDQVIERFKEKDFEKLIGGHIVNSVWHVPDYYTIPEVIDRLVELGDRVEVKTFNGVHHRVEWNFKKAIATIISIVERINDDQLTKELVSCLSVLQLCDLGKLINLVYVIQEYVLENPPLDYSQRKLWDYTRVLGDVIEKLRGKFGDRSKESKDVILKYYIDMLENKPAAQWSKETQMLHGMLVKEFRSHTKPTDESYHFREGLGVIGRGLIEVLGANDIAARDEAGNTLLHRAAMEGRLEDVKRWLDLGSDPMAKNAEGKTAADIAHERENEDIERELLNIRKRFGLKETLKEWRELFREAQEGRFSELCMEAFKEDSLEHAKELLESTTLESKYLFGNFKLVPQATIDEIYETISKEHPNLAGSFFRLLKENCEFSADVEKYITAQVTAQVTAQEHAQAIEVAVDEDAEAADVQTNKVPQEATGPAIQHELPLAGADLELIYYTE